jgi:hypothetical protein
MQFLPFLGKQLKDDDVIAVLEDMGMEVLYDFDRLHEGQPDKYWGASNAAGFQFGFDSAQTLNVIFLHIAPTNGFAAISRQDCDIPLFATASETEILARSSICRSRRGALISLELLVTGCDSDLRDTQYTMNFMDPFSPWSRLYKMMRIKPSNRLPGAFCDSLSVKRAFYMLT